MGGARFKASWGDEGDGAKLDGFESGISRDAVMEECGYGPS